MSVAIAEEPHVLHMVPGRVRVHLPGWSRRGNRYLETRLRQVEGVRSVQANTLTGNILINFDPAVTHEQAILAALRTLDLDMINAREDKPPPPVLREKRGRTVRAHIAVRGLDRDPHLAKRVVERLARRPGVRTRVNFLTGHVLVEFTERETELEDLVAEIEDLELPDLPDEDRPAFPLDPGPLIQSEAHTIGSALGLTLLAARRLLGFAEPFPGATSAIQVAAVVGIVQSVPPIRHRLRRLFGRTVADVLLSVSGIITLTLSGSPLGLLVTGGEALRLLIEVLARRSAWRRHEERVENAPIAHPDAVIRLGAGERTPLAASVVEGTGTAIGRDGMLQPVIQGGTVPAGARLYGGPFVLKLESQAPFQAFTPGPRPAPLAPSIFDRYKQVAGLLSLVYAGVTALLTRSFSQTLAALLVVNPRTATIGLDSADLGANIRALRAGTTIVGTRIDRTIRLPNLVLLEGARLLTDGLELTGALALNEDYDATEILAQAAGVATEAGSPWGGVLRATGNVSVTNGTFDGRVATAYAEGVRYSLGPVEDWSSIPEAEYLKQPDNYVLMLRSDREEKPLGIFAIRPQLATGIQDLVQTCQRYGVELGVLAGAGEQIAVRALAHRANVAPFESDDAVNVIRAKQSEGAFVVFVSDNAGAAAAFAACDLAIGIKDDREHLPARADLLAPDLSAVAAIIEAATLREMTVRDSIGLSIVANIIGAVLGFQGMLGIREALRVVHITALAALADAWIRLRGGIRSGSSIPGS